MPVLRNFSLPASIESRKKKRPETLSRSNTDVLGSGSTIHSSKPVELSLFKVNRPRYFDSTTKANSNNNNDVASDETTTPTNESNKEVAEPTNKAAMGVDSITTRGGTLSQPCVLVSVGATQIFPHLFLGSQKDVVDENMMRTNGITYVLNVSKTCTKPEFIDDSHFHRISVHDSYQEKITPHMIEAIEFIEKVRKSNNRVIVHCLAGVSRSATVAIAYVLHYLRISFEDAYRFVKEKRPSISPNFNFLGQLMEFEKSLQSSGYLTCKRTGSLSEDSDNNDSQPKFSCNQESDSKRTHLGLNIFNSETDCSPLIMPATCSFQCSTQFTAPRQGTTLRISTPTSSFCRRRNGPTFSKDAFSAVSNANNSCNRKCETAMPKFMHEPGIVVDVHVKALQAARVSDASRRLGSDGYEKDEAMPCDSVHASYSTDAFTSSAACSQAQQSMDCSEVSENNAEDNFIRPRTAPSTPIVGRQKSGRNSPWRHGQLAPPKPKPRHRRCASGGGITTEVLLSPLNMKRRLETRTERSSSIGDVSLTDQAMEVEHCTSVKRGASFSGSYYDQSTTSTRSPHKFISVNSRSPKILRKSFQLNLRPVYPQSRNGTKSEDAAAPFSTPSVLAMDTQIPVFDCSHSMSASTEPLKLDFRKGLTIKGNSAMKEGTTPDPESDETLVVDSIAPLTLSSPNVDKDGSPLFTSTDSAKVTSPATCPVLVSNGTAPSFSRNDSSRNVGYKASFALTDAKTNRPFTLTSPCELKLKWRNKDRRRQSVDSGYLSSQASSQSSSSFTSPIFQQNDFASGSSQDSFAEVGTPEAARTSSPASSSCHVEGAFDDVTNTNSDPDGRQTNVRQRNAVEIVGCS